MSCLRRVEVFTLNWIPGIYKYFAAFDSTLRPTAGYFKDGRRFIEDIKTNLPHVTYDTNQLIRCR